MTTNHEINQQWDEENFLGTGTTRYTFFKRTLIVALLLFVIVAFASGYYTLLIRTEPPPREPVPISQESDVRTSLQHPELHLFSVA